MAFDVVDKRDELPRNEVETFDAHGFEFEVAHFGRDFEIAN